MHTWVERESEIEFLVSLYGAALRLRFSSRLRIARVDLFRKGGEPLEAEMALVSRGWSKSEKRLNAPAGIVGVRYEHTTLTKKNAAYTKALLLRYLKYWNKTSAMDGMFREINENRVGLSSLAEDIKATEY